MSNQIKVDLEVVPNPVEIELTRVFGDVPYIPLSALGQPDGAASLDSDGKLTQAQIPNNVIVDTQLSETLLDYIKAVEKGVANGVASLGTDGKVPFAQLPASSGGGGGLPIGTTIQHLGTDPPEGFLKLNGADLRRDTYPELWDWVENKSGLLIAEGLWQTYYNLNGGNVGYYSSGWDDEHFRLPNITAFLRPQGYSDRDVGDYQGDAIRNFTGTFSTSPIHGVLVGSGANQGYTTGVFTRGEALANTLAASAGASGFGLKIDPSLVVPTADENRPKAITVLLCVKAFGTVVDDGTVVVAELANEVATLSGKINALENAIDFTYIYPNGGDELNPASILANSRYLNDNPFPNKPVICQAEVFYPNTGQWGITGWFYASGGLGVTSSHLMPDDAIVTQSGSAAPLHLMSSFSGGGFGTTVNNNTTNVPVRVKVWKVG